MAHDNQLKERIRATSTCKTPPAACCYPLICVLASTWKSSKSGDRDEASSLSERVILTEAEVAMREPADAPVSLTTRLLNELRLRRDLARLDNQVGKLGSNQE